MIQLKAVPWSALRDSDAPLVVFAFEDSGVAGASMLAPKVRRALLDKAKADGFKGSASETLSLTASDGLRERRFILAGLGKRKEAGLETVRRAAGSAGQYARRRFKTIGVLPPPEAQAAGEGLLLSSYRFEEYRKPDAEAQWAEAQLAIETPAQRSKLEAAAARATLHAEAVCYARDLVNRGPSDKKPEALGKLAQELGSGTVTVKIIDRKEAEKLGMGSYLSVTRGASAPPSFVHLIYRPKGAKRKIGLVGKGIAFDSGGLSLKPPQSMEDMKMDMAGAALVLGVFKVLERLAVKAEVHGFCAFAYNMPGPDATKPGDIVRAMNGKTIEVLNTDAEGRLVLADALVYASQQKLDALLDFATLTGAQLVALGSSVTAVMANDKGLLARYQAAAKRAGEDVWELPLVAEYKDRLKSSVADLRNISKVRVEAGTIIGGLFLQEFVDGRPWAHFDIAGPAWAGSDGPTCPEGGTGALVRSTLEYLCAL
ncbi:MAG: leucyl aminopeptidase [Elusimicrobia bacterium]|nr:leucyl aminopeptidase [Elusimicrobiota bacterium]